MNLLKRLLSIICFYKVLNEYLIQVQILMNDEKVRDNILLICNLRTCIEYFFFDCGG